MAPTKDKDEVSYPQNLVQVLENHSGPVNVVQYNHGAKYCLSGSSDRSIKLWNPATGKQIKSYDGHGREVLGLDIAHDNAKFASCGGDKLVFVWDVPSGTILRKLQGHFGRINCVAFSKDAQVLASAGFDAKIMLWDMRAAARDPIHSFKDATSSIVSLLLPSNELSPEVISGSTDGHVRTYDMRMGRMTEDLIGSPIISLATSPQHPKESLLISTADGKVRIMDRANGNMLQTFEGHAGGERSGRAIWAYGEGGAICGDEEGRLWCWDVLSAKPIDPHPKLVHKKAITWVEMTPNGKEMLTASADGVVKVWRK